MSKKMGNWMRHGTVGVSLIGLAAALLLSSTMAGCVADGTHLRAQRDQIREQSSQIEERAYRCAPRELALANAHAEFGAEELSVGNGRRAVDHILFAEKNIQDADNKSLNILCQDPTRSDRDGDGIIDQDDTCPDIPGLAEFKGCPDPDPDKDKVCSLWVAENSLSGKFDCQGMDYCPDIPGTLAYAGCPSPDADNDAVCDPWVGEMGMHEKFPSCSGSDECVDVPGKPEFFGCPEPDPDNDGICNKWVQEKGMMGKFPCDGMDECPFEAGEREYNGCPPPRKFIVVTEDKIELNEPVFFATNKTKVLPRSEPLLDEIADVLVKNPGMHLRIEGHTDSSGKYKSNVKLSKGRAKSVLDELVKRGIAQERLVSEGYGPDRPIDTNDTPEGKANNRRVEFHITKR